MVPGRSIHFLKAEAFWSVIAKMVCLFFLRFLSRVASVFSGFRVWLCFFVAGEARQFE
jgi:hypothetical protein